MPNTFEFGCGQLRLGDSFADCLRRAYEDDFGVTIKVAENPIPVETFVIDDQEEHRKIPGILFMAEIESPDLVQQKFSRQKHTEIAWVDPLTFKPVHHQKYVPDLIDALRAAFGAWKKKEILLKSSRSRAGLLNKYN